MENDQGPQVYSPTPQQPSQGDPVVSSAPASMNNNSTPPSAPASVGFPPAPVSPPPASVPTSSPAPAFPSGNPFDQGASPVANNPTTPPPPPSMDERVGVRTMASDQASIQQSGGQAPQPEIISAPPLSSAQPIQPSPQSATMGSEPSNYEQPQLSTSEEGMVIPPVPGKSGKIKTIAIIVGIIVAAGVVGFGIYYLVSSLYSSPEVVVTPPQQEFPLVDLGLEEEEDVVVEEQPSQEELLFVHSSLLTTSDDVVETPLQETTLPMFEASVVAAAQPALPDGGVREITFVDSNQAPVSSQTLLSAYLPSQPALSSLFAPDMTAWLYFDATGAQVATPRFGVAFTLADGIDLAQAQSTVATALEASSQEIGSLFVSNMTPQASASFDDGVVGETPVRFLVYGAGYVFEYGWITNVSGTHLVLTTSYKQMLDATSRISNVSL